MENLGFLAALGAALAWGSYNTPFKISKSKNLKQFQALTGVGVLISGLILSLFLGYSLNLNIYGWVAGVMWALANTLSLAAITNLGISKTVPITSSLVIICSFILGTLVFKEIPQGLILASLGMILIVLGVIIVSTTSKSKADNSKKGVLAAISAGLLWGVHIAPLKIGNLSAIDFFFPFCFGIFITSVAIALVSKVQFKYQAIKESLLSGVIWNIGNLLSIISISLIGLAKAFSLSQAAILISVLWGIFYFKEITNPKQRAQVLIGAAVLLLGVILLGLA